MLRVWLTDTSLFLEGIFFSSTLGSRSYPSLSFFQTWFDLYDWASVLGNSLYKSCIVLSFILDSENKLNLWRFIVVIARWSLAILPYLRYCLFYSGDPAAIFALSSSVISRPSKLPPRHSMLRTVCANSIAFLYSYDLCSLFRVVAVFLMIFWERFATWRRCMIFSCLNLSFYSCLMNSIPSPILFYLAGWFLYSSTKKLKSC